ncbi:MAG: hypothetical protein GEU73_00200 [Chloroflexi bacterium]|nr:hypothetical protein [Chloroflexota bacterium]
MTIRYYVSHSQVLPEYCCQREGIENAHAPCLRVLGAALDRAIGNLLVETVSPLALEVALAVQDELEARAQEVDRIRRQQVERARYEAELAQRRYLRVDPDNRLVADSLEAEWNTKLRALAAAQEEYERQRAGEGGVLSPDQRRQVMTLVTDFPRLWHDPATPQRERKRMVRLLLEDVTLLKADAVVAQIRFRGGATHTIRLPLPVPAPELRKTAPAMVAEIDRLIDDHIDAEIAEILNARGLRPGVADRFTNSSIWHIRQRYRLENRFSRLRRQGMLTLQEISVALGQHPSTVKERATRGQLVSYVYNDKGQRLYALSGEPALIACLRCSKPMPERGERGQLQTYCGVTCRTAAYAHRRAAAGWIRVRRRSPLRYRTPSNPRGAV